MFTNQSQLTTLLGSQKKFCFVYRKKFHVILFTSRSTIVKRTTNCKKAHFYIFLSAKRRNKNQNCFKYHLKRKRIMRQIISWQKKRFTLAIFSFRIPSRVIGKARISLAQLFSVPLVPNFSGQSTRETKLTVPILAVQTKEGNFL